MIGFPDGRDPEFLAFQILDVSYFRTDNQEINSLLERHQDELQRKPLENPAKSADEGRRERNIAIHYGHACNPRTDLNQLDLQSFLAKEVLGHGDVERRRDVASARVSDPDFLGLSVKRTARTGKNTQAGDQQHQSEISRLVESHCGFSLLESHYFDPSSFASAGVAADRFAISAPAEHRRALPISGDKIDLTSASRAARDRSDCHRDRRPGTRPLGWA